MAKVLQNFLIGVGLDTEKYDKGAKNVESSLGRMRTLVGFTGAAITGAFAAVGGGAVAAGNRIDKFVLATEGLKTSPDYIYAYGRALAAMGGDASAAVTAINSAEDALAQFKLKGTFGPFEEAAFAGVRDELYSLMHAVDGGELIRGFAGVMPSLNKDQQRLIQNAFSFSPEVMRSLREGAGGFDARIERAFGLIGDGIQGAVESAREYNRALDELDTRFQRIGNTLAEKVLPGFTGIIDSFGEFLDKNHDLMGRGAEIVGNNPEAAMLIGSGALASPTGALMQKLGLKGLGGLVSRAGPIGMATGAAMMAWDTKPDDIEALTGYKPSSYIFEKTPMDAVRDGWDYLSNNELPVASPESYGQLGPLPEGSWPVNQMNYHEPGYQRSESPYSGVMPVEVNNIHEPEYQIFESPSSGFVQPYEPVYAGGEVSNSEAASVSPEIIMLKEQREHADRPLTPQRMDVKNNLDLHVEIDGRAIDSRVVDVIERREREALGDFYSSVNR